MSLSSGKSLRPLTIPDIDSERDLGLEISSGSCHSNHRCTSLKADCLQSPVNPATWEGASSLARFGLDIGGTLCKVVYFEPFDHPQSCTASSKFGSRNAALHAESWGVSITETESARRCNDKHVSDSSFRLTEGDAVQGKKGMIFDDQQPDHENLKEPCMAEDRCSGFSLSEERSYGENFGKLSTGTARDGKNITENCAPCYKDRLDKSCTGGSPLGERELCDTKHDSVKAKWEKLMHEGITGEEPTANDKHFKQVPKIWVSSHDPVPLLGRGTLYFKCFETWRMEEFLLLTREHSLVTGGRALGATGGGARKFGQQFLGIAGLKLKHADELKSLVRGIDFLMKHAQHESFEYPKGSFQGGVIQRPFKSPENISDDGDSDISEEESWSCVNHLNDDRPESKEICISMNNPHGSDRLDKAVGGKRTRGTAVPSPILTSERGESLEGNLNLYPYLVVNIGSGVSILLVDSPEQFQRVGGTSLGGSTFFGLASILTGCDSFEEAIDLAAEGDSTEIDMLVGDIYDEKQLVQPQRRAAALKNPQHLAKATLLMITNNIGSLAKLHAQATGVDRVLFTGSFMHGNKLAMRLLAVAMEFWSKGQMKAIFLQHEGHAGAMGALLSALNPKDPTDALLLN